jgi:hypothetical protein
LAAARLIPESTDLHRVAAAPFIAGRAYAGAPVPSKKRQSAFRAADVPRVFNDARIKDLAKIGHLPVDADRQRFADGVRKAACVYAMGAQKPNNNTMRDEIEQFHRAAARPKQKDTRVANLVAKLSPETLQWLKAREATPGFERVGRVGLKFPSLEDLRDPARRDEFCDIVRRFCSFGGMYIEGRRRPSGKRSIAWTASLYAPERISHPPKREAERRFVMQLRLAWLEATGEPPTATVNPGSSDRPFVNMLRECLRLVDAGHADAVGLINDLNNRRVQMEINEPP